MTVTGTPPPIVDAMPRHAPAREPRNGSWIVLVAGVAALAGLHLVLSRSIGGFLLADGTGYLANARWLVGKAGTTWQGPAAFYNAGWSIVVAPIYLFTRSPGAVHSGVLLVNALLASASFVAYTALAERAFGMRRRLALVAGLVAATYPAVLLQASFEWSESLFHLLFPLLLLAVLGLLRTGTPASAVAVALAGAALNATHPKGLGAVIAIGVAFVVLGARRIVPWRAAAAGLVALVVAFVATLALHGALQEALYAKSAAAIEGDVLKRVTDPTLVWGAFRRLWGQLWYLTVASVGLFPLGVVALVRHRDRRFAAITLGTCLMILAASCLEMSDGTRVDHMVYGRYDEGFLPSILVAGAAALVLHRKDALRLAAIGAALSGVLAALALAFNGTSRFHGDVMPLNVVGVLVYRGDVNEIDVVVVTLLALLPLAALALASRRSAGIGLAVLIVFFVGSSLSVEARTVQPWQRFWSSVTEIPEAVHAIGRQPVAYDLGSRYDPDAADLYQLELTDLGGLRFFDSTRGEAPPADLVIAGPRWPHPGARLVFAETGPHHQALWVVPGALSNELGRRGFLVPAVYTTPLPADAQLATLDIGSTGFTIPARASRVVRVHVSHDGAGAPWLPVGPVPGVVEGTVRLGARWYDGAGAEVASQTAELPRTLLPGDEIDVRIRLTADVAPGTYRVVVALRQEGVAWWDASAVTLQVSVRS